jgi:predicted DNA-binding transcriptional regulator AlpA
MQNQAQSDFLEKYVTAAEIRQLLGVTKATITRAKATKRLPAPITLPGSKLAVWERVSIMPYIQAWKVVLDVRRAGK